MPTYIPTPINVTPPDVSNLRRLAFIEALEETDPETRTQVKDMIDALADVFQKHGNLKPYAARNQATEFVGACIWKGVNATRK